MSPYALLHIQINIVQLGVQWHNFFYFKSLTKISDPGLVDWPWSCCGPLAPWSPSSTSSPAYRNIYTGNYFGKSAKSYRLNFKCGSGTRMVNIKPVQTLDTHPVQPLNTHPVQTLNTHPVQI